MLNKHFEYWTALTLFSVVNLTSLTNHFDEESHKDWSTEQRWVISAASISLVLSVTACFMHIVGIKEIFAGKSLEIGWVVVVLAMWCASLPFLMDADNMFAVDNWLGSGLSSILNGNLFFSAWGALIYSLLLATSHFVMYYKREEDTHLYHWVGFATASLIVMCSTARYFKRECSDVELSDDMTCSRAAFGLALGAISATTAISVVWIDVRKMLAQILSIVFVVVWGFGVSYLTFDEGPGVPVGTLYFATWLGLLFILFVAAPAFLEMCQNVFDVDSQQASSAAAEGDAPSNTKDDNKVDDGNKVGGGEEMEEEEVAESA